MQAEGEGSFFPHTLPYCPGPRKTALITTLTEHTITPFGCIR